MTHYMGDSTEDEILKDELHEMLVPAALKIPWNNLLDDINMYLYYIRFVPVPEDRHYRMFGLLIKDPLPKEAETLELDLHLDLGRIVKTGLSPIGIIKLSREEIILAQNFQEMFLKIILDRSEFWSEYVPLGKNDAAPYKSSTFYLLLPIKQQMSGEGMIIDWTTIKRCLSSPVFGCLINSYERSHIPVSDTLELLSGPINKCDVLDSLVFTPHNKSFFFIDGIHDGTNAYKKRFKLSHPEQPFLKAKKLFSVHTLLQNRLQESTKAREKEEHFMALPPELCSLKIVGFSKDIGSSLSLLPSLMHRLENFLVATELKEVLSASFPEGSGIRADCIFEALTTRKCLERLSLERFEVLGDAFLKYTVGRHSFLSYEGLDEGQLTIKRSSIVNNLHLYELAIKNNLQEYICDEMFDPSKFFAFGRPCTVVCDVDTESSIHCQQGKVATNVKCTRSHRWLNRKTIADVVEALVGAFLVESGFKAATAFLQWIGIKVDFKVSDVYKIWEESRIIMALIENTDIDALEELLGHKFKHRGLLLQAIVHPSYKKHSGGCYQKLEFLGDAVLDYLITSYLYSVYPDLKPGQITDLRSIAVNNNLFAHIAVRISLHKHLIKDSNSLTEAIKKFESFVSLDDSEGDLLEETACPKVLGDIVESCIGAILLDTGFNLTHVWSIMLTILGPVLCFSSLHLDPLRELRELCQCHNFDLGLPVPVKDRECYVVKVEVDVEAKYFAFSATNHNSKAARRMAAQKALSKLKALGFKHKSKSLEEILQTSRKKEPKLIGFDEEPIEKKIIDADFISLEKLRNQEPEMIPPKLSLRKAEELSSPSKGNTLHKQQSVASSSVGKPEAMTSETCDGNKEHEPVIIDLVGAYAAAENSNHKERTVADKTARSCLFEICTANHWDPPLFECCKEEWQSNLRMIVTQGHSLELVVALVGSMCLIIFGFPYLLLLLLLMFVSPRLVSRSGNMRFTYKAVVQVKGAATTHVECYSEPKSQKRAAQEHAAEGILWYLKHHGYIPNP